MIVVADTSGIFAALDKAQPEHRAAASVMEQEHLAISPLVLTELDHLIHRGVGFDAAVSALAALTSRITDGHYRLAELRPADLAAAHEVRVKYQSLRLDLADAVGVVLADRYQTDRIFTLDQRDYRAVTPLTPGLSAFRILPADGS